MAILKAQRAKGWQTVQLTSPRHEVSAKGPAAACEDVGDFRFWRTPAPTAGQGKPWWPLGEMAATTRALEALARQEQPDVLHAHSPALNAHPALRVGRRLGIPVVYEVRAFWEDAAVDHGTATEGGLRYKLTRGLETRALRQADHVTCICEGLRGDIVARGVPAAGVTVIPNAVEAQRFQLVQGRDAELERQLGLQGAWVVGFCGSFYAYEGLDLLVAALPRLVQAIPHIKLLLVGGGPEDARLKAQVAQLGMSDRVVFTGRVPNDVIDRYYSLIDALAFPRKRMRLTELVTPLKPLETMAQGLPVVASDVGGHRELIDHGRTGLLFAADDEAALAACLKQVHDQPELGRRLRDEGRRHVETQRTWAHSVARYDAVYAAARARRRG